MRILPVLDLLDGAVVRGVAGERQHYRPVKSVWTTATEPLAVAAAIHTTFGLNVFYVADLDAILNRRPSFDVFRSLANVGFELLADAGIRTADDALPVLEAGATQVITGLETLAGAKELERLISRFGPEKIVFSLDMHEGFALGDREHWPSDDAWQIAKRVLDAGVTNIIVLDLRAVGVGRGVTTLPLCARIKETFPHVSLITGGGVRGIGDLEALRRAGLDGALVASAIHDGSLGPEALRDFTQRSTTAASGTDVP